MKTNLKFREVVWLSWLEPGDRFYFFNAPDTACVVTAKKGETIWYSNSGANKHGRKMYHNVEVAFLRHAAINS